MLSHRVRKGLYLKYRELNQFLVDRMIGLDDPKDDELTDDYESSESIRERIQRGVREYISSFEEEDVKKSNEIDQVEKARENAQENIDYLRDLIAEKTKGTIFESNLEFLKRNANENVKTIKEDVVGQERIDQGIEHLHDLKSKHDSVLDTVQENVTELASAAQNSKEKIQNVTQEDMKRTQNDLEEWIADKLVVGRLTLSAFIEGYRLGKEEALVMKPPKPFL